jgi:hypothetical protein
MASAVAVSGLLVPAFSQTTMMTIKVRTLIKPSTQYKHGRASSEALS